MADVTTKTPTPTSGQEWRDLREAWECTIEQLAIRTGLSAHVIERLEDGRPVALPARKLIGAALGLDVAEVVNRADL